MTIRTMNTEDFEKIYDLWIHTEGMGLNTTDDSKDGIVKYLLRNPNTCFVAEDNGKLIGVIIRGHDGRRGFIYHTTVKKEYGDRELGKVGRLSNKSFERRGHTQSGIGGI